jgi:CRISPR-associated protein Cas5d
MFHGFDYPDETGENKLEARFWRPKMIDGVVRFVPPEQCDIRKFIREMHPKQFRRGHNLVSVEAEATALGC